MDNSQKKAAQLRQKIQKIIDEAGLLEKAHEHQLKLIHPQYIASARNLLHYKALRRHDLRYLQKNLRNFGLSRLAKAERHVLSSLKYTNAYLGGYENGILEVPDQFELSIKEGTKRLNKHSKALLGKRSLGRMVRIMVTLPSEAATNVTLVEDLVAAGMDTARINCAHDDAGTWEKMIANVKEASHLLKRKVKISMDLGGPKIRTGSIQSGHSVLRLKPIKNELGAVTAPLVIRLVPLESYRASENTLPVDRAVLGTMQVGDRLVFKDTRNKKRAITIVEVSDNLVTGTLESTAYIRSKLPFQLHEETFAFGALSPMEGQLRLQQGDLLLVQANLEIGHNATLNEEGKLLKPAHIGCTNADVFKDVEEGHRVFFDDGKIGGLIKQVDREVMQVEITTGGLTTQKLRSDKGINFPDSALTLSGLTEKDRQDLEFVTAHADVVNFSFVNCAQDVKDLLEVLDHYEVKDKIGIILKIETRRGFNNLMEILMMAMQTFPIGVMIARGDLAIECGWENLGSLQEEIMRICEAAHIPDVWATQVLENLAKKGIPSRAEITDASMGQRAECVMLNKGPHILEAIQLLHEILKNMKSYQDKKDVILPILEQYEQAPVDLP